MRSSQSKSQQVTQEETDRHTVRNSLTQWARFALQPLGQSPATHHHLLIDELAKVASGETDRLMLLLPPGSAKSTYASLNMLLGTLAAMATSVVSYWVGSSAGSARKDEHIAQLASSQPTAA
jgi:hypothetical protein